MSHIFISYAREDSGFTEDLVRDFKRRGLRCWVDHADLEPGRIWRQELAQAIRDCATFVVVLSPRSAQSDEVMREVGYAASRGRRIVPVIYEAAVLPPEMELVVSNVQWLRFDELTYEEAFERLLRAIVPTAPESRPDPRPRPVWWIALGSGTHPAPIASFAIFCASSLASSGSVTCTAGNAVS